MSAIVFFKMVNIGQKWSKMVQNGDKRPTKLKGGQKWSTIVNNGQQPSTTLTTVKNIIKKVKDSQKWSNTVKNGQKLSIMVKNGLQL